MVVTREERARRNAAFEKRSEARDREVEQYAASKRSAKKEDQAYQSAKERQENALRRGVGAGTVGPIYGSTGERRPTDPRLNAVPAPISVLTPKPVLQVPEQPIYELVSFELGPRPPTPNAPMTFMYTQPVIGSLMVMDGGRLMMAISFQPGDYPDLSRAWTVPRWSRLTLRAHTGRGTLGGGESVGTIITPFLPTIPPEFLPGPNDSFWDGMRKGFEWAAPLVADAWEAWLGIDGNVF